MKIKKIIASAAAAALTVGAMTVNAFAADNLLSGDVNLGKGWGGEYIDTSKFVDAAEGDVVTVEYIINNEDSYHLVQIASGADGWPILECATKAVNNQEDADFKNQDDGFAVVSVSGSVSYTLTAADADEIAISGMTVRGYDITVKSVTVKTPEVVNTEASETSAPELVTDATENTNNSENDKTNADTGVEGVAAVAGFATIAALGVIIAKKRN